MLEVKTAGKLGYCFGISQAIDKAVRYAEENGPLYTLGTLAHNEAVVELLREHGIEPIDVERIAPGMNVAITAHGASPVTYRYLEEMGCKVLDCTCRIVRKAQEVVSQQLDGFDIVIYGDPVHQEVIGLNGWANGTKFVGTFNGLFTTGQGHKRLGLRKKVGVISQTTQIPPLFTDFVTTLINHHIERFQELRVFNTICPIVAQRIRDTEKVASEVDMMLVVGSQESANTKSLALVAESVLEANSIFIIQNQDQVPATLGEWWTQTDRAGRRAVETSLRVGVTAGTSSPIEVVEQVVQRVKEVAGGS